MQATTPELLAISRRAVRPLLDHGFRTVSELYADYNLGNICIELESSQLGLRFTSDRGQYFVEVRNLADEEWFDEHTVLTFLGAQEAAEELIQQKRQLAEGAVSAVDQHFAAIVAAFSVERYPKTKEGLRLIERDRAERLFGYHAPPN